MRNQDTPIWYYNFKQSIAYQDYQLKGLSSALDYYPVDSLPCVRFVEEQEFYHKQADIIPLFVEGAQGIYPYIPADVYPQLEGQLIALLKTISNEPSQPKLVIYQRKEKLYELAVFDSIENGSLQERIEYFNKLSDNQKLTMFMELITNGRRSEYDELLKLWWAKRY